MKIGSASWVLIILLILAGGLIVFATVFSLSNTRDIQSAWVGFEESRSVKARTLSALRSQLGYGGMIHNFKNHILRQDHTYSLAAAASLGGARAELTRYKTLRLNISEQQAVHDIAGVLNAYGHALATVEDLVSAGKTPAEIDRMIRVNDEPAIRGLISLEEAEEGNREAQPNKASIVSALRSAIGFGGMIHHYKNYLLRHEPSLNESIKADIFRAWQALAKYEEFGINDLEKNAISRIRNVLADYEKQSLNITRLIQQGRTPVEIDRVVYVDDEPALSALIDLDREIVAQSEEGAIKLDNALDWVMALETLALYVAIIATILLVAGCFWLIRIQIIGPVGRLTDIMTRLAREDLEVDVYGVNKKNEIGDMARSLEVFKNNVVLLQKTKQALHESNQNLEQRIAERTHDLEYSEARLRSIVETAADAIISIDERGIIRSFNSAAVKLFGYSREEALGKHVQILVPERCKGHYGSELLQYLQDGGAEITGEGREVVALRKNGDTFPIELAVSEIGEAGEKLFTGIIRDVTEKKVVEQRLRQSKIAADQANQAKSEFLASMSHELRTPLNAILGFAQVMEIGAQKSQTALQKEALSNILKAGNHLLELVDQILDLNRIEMGGMSIVFEPVALQEVLAECLSLIQTRAAEKEIALIDHTVDSDIPTLWTDATRIKQVLLNLLSNAIKYNRHGGSVTLDCQEAPDGNFRLIISDTGEGIPAGIQENLFEPFDRLGRESGNIEGTGIGLTISKKIMELLHGNIGYDSKFGKGSRFWIDIPLGSGDAADKTNIASVVKSIRNFDKREDGASHTVLYIEDNPANMRLMQVIIEQLGHVHLLTAHNAALGIDLARQRKPDLILMDINLPDMPGTEALINLRRIRETAHIPVIAISADAMPDDIKAGLSAGFVDYLTKPLNVPNTLQVITDVLNGV